MKKRLKKEHKAVLLKIDDFLKKGDFYLFSHSEYDTMRTRIKPKQK